MIPISYNLRSIRVRKVTSAAAAFGIGLVVFVFSAAMMLSEGIEQTLGRTASADIAIVMRKGADAEMSSGIDTKHIPIVLAEKAVAKASDGQPLGVGEVIVVIILDKLGTDGIANVQIRGVPENVLAFRNSVKIIEGRAAKTGTDEVMIGKAIRGRFRGLEIGESFELRKNRPVTVVGVFEDGASSFESEVWGDVETVGRSFGRDGVSSIRVKLTNADEFDSFKANVESNRQLNLQVQRESTYYEKQSEGTSLFIKVMGILISVFFSVGAMIGAMITMHASVAHRQREIGTLRALGFSRMSIMTSFLIESIVLSLVGGGVGAVASLLMKFARFATMNQATWSEIVFTFDPTPKIIISAMILAGAMGLVGGFFPALRAARMSPIEAMRA
jgi:putative ABC transport system permease protein